MSDVAALGMVIQSGRVDRVHYALLFAAGAAVAGFAELWESLQDMGVQFQACDSGLAASEVSAPAGIEITGVVGFLHGIGPQAQVIWV